MSMTLKDIVGVILWVVVIVSIFSMARWALGPLFMVPVQGVVVEATPTPTPKPIDPRETDEAKLTRKVEEFIEMNPLED